VPADDPGCDSAIPAAAVSEEQAERHATWIELFFDLVAVAGISQLTHLVRDGASAGDFGRYVVLYTAFWTVWACITMYGNMAAERIRVLVVLLAMLGLGIMTAAVADIVEHATAFALTYVVVRLAAAQLWNRAQIVVDWPTAQLLGGVIPWVVSFWVGEPMRYWLWGLGLAVDLAVIFTVSTDRLMRGAQHDLDRKMRHSRRFRGVEMPTLQAAYADTSHLAERLGLFVIIVLGEGVIGMIAAAADVEWDGRLLATGVAAFALLVSIWALSLLYGFAGVPRLKPDAVPSRIAMSMHLFATGAIAVVAAGLGTAMEDPHAAVSTGVAWLMCGGTAAYFAVTAAAGVLNRRRWSALASWPLPGAGIALALVALGPHIAAVWLVAMLAVTMGGALVYEYRAGGGYERFVQQVAG